MKTTLAVVVSLFASGPALASCYGTPTPTGFIRNRDIYDRLMQSTQQAGDGHFLTRVDEESCSKGTYIVPGSEIGIFNRAGVKGIELAANSITAGPFYTVVEASFLTKFRVLGPTHILAPLEIYIKTEGFAGQDGDGAALIQSYVTIESDAAARAYLDFTISARSYIDDPRSFGKFSFEGWLPFTVPTFQQEIVTEGMSSQIDGGGSSPGEGTGHIYAGTASTYGYLDPEVRIVPLWAAAHPGYTLQFETSSGVPEPAPWALIVSGFGVIGANVRRRRSVTLAY